MQLKEVLLRVRPYLVLVIGLEVVSQTQNKSKKGPELRMIKINSQSWRERKSRSKKIILSVQEL